MSVKFISKPLGGRMTQFTSKGRLAAFALAEHGDDLFSLRVCQGFFPKEAEFVFELRHQRRGRIVESICDRLGFNGRLKLVETVRATVLAAEAEVASSEKVGEVRNEIIRQVAQLPHPVSPFSYSGG